MQPVMGQDPQARSPPRRTTPLGQLRSGPRGGWGCQSRSLGWGAELGCPLRDAIKSQDRSTSERLSRAHVKGKGQEGETRWRGLPI